MATEVHKLITDGTKELIAAVKAEDRTLGSLADSRDRMLEITITIKVAQRQLHDGCKPPINEAEMAAGLLALQKAVEDEQAELRLYNELKDELRVNVIRIKEAQCAIYNGVRFDCGCENEFKRPGQQLLKPECPVRLSDMPTFAECLQEAFPLRKD